MRSYISWLLNSTHSLRIIFCHASLHRHVFSFARFSEIVVARKLGCMVSVGRSVEGPTTESTRKTFNTWLYARRNDDQTAWRPLVHCRQSQAADLRICRKLHWRILIFDNLPSMSAYMQSIDICVYVHQSFGWNMKWGHFDPFGPRIIPFGKPIIVLLIPIYCWFPLRAYVISCRFQLLSSLFCFRPSVPETMTFMSLHRLKLMLRRVAKMMRLIWLETVQEVAVNLIANDLQWPNEVDSSATFWTRACLKRRRLILTLELRPNGGREEQNFVLRDMRKSLVDFQLVQIPTR